MADENFDSSGNVTADELRYIEHVAPLLERSPRALKRFANVYRLLKASLPEGLVADALHDRVGVGQRVDLLLLRSVTNRFPQRRLDGAHHREQFRP